MFSISDSGIAAQEVHLELQAKGGFAEYFCTNDSIKTVCSIHNSTVLEWKSVCFIGMHQRILFVHDDKVQAAKFKQATHAFLSHNEAYSSDNINDCRRNFSSTIYSDVQAQHSGVCEIECLSSDHTIKQRKKIKISGKFNYIVVIILL